MNTGTIGDGSVPPEHAGLTAVDVAIRILGRCAYPSPVAERLGDRAMNFVGESDKVLFDDRLSSLRARAAAGRQASSGEETVAAFELAGPRNCLFFDPGQLRCGIVTCGGLCPGINNVVRGIVYELTYGYGARHVFGFRYGYEGLIEDRHPPLRLEPDVVKDIHLQGGTLLGTSRGNQDAGAMVDTLERLGINALFVVGGDGTIRGAMTLVAEIARRGSSIAVVGIPKTIDNDIHFTDRSFGFESAYSAAVDVIRSAHTEATGAFNGIGLVKLMGRHAGFVAAHAALASADANVVLVPEVPVRLGGPRGLLSFLEGRLSARRHAVIVVAEGAGQDLLDGQATAGSDAKLSSATDASGNARLRDIGMFLKQAIETHFRDRRMDITLKYLDPSYYIRSVPASASDSVYCWRMARHAVHAAMAGNTEMIIGRWHGRFVHVPMGLATRTRKQVDPMDDLWMSVIEATGQPVNWS
jgi:6-phosphofructokinase 1